MTGCLFVYGTLMRSARSALLGRDMRERLEREAVWLGPATISGRLYNLGVYPALVEPQQPSDLVHGEVWQLFDPIATLEWLDPYEGLKAGTLQGDEYERGVRTVTLIDGRSLDAHVFLYIGKILRAQHVPEGRWHPTNG